MTTLVTANSSSQEKMSHSSPLRPFHLAVQVHDLSLARQFYGELFGCPEGRSDINWVDFDFFGHQFVCHLNPNKLTGDAHVNAVDGHGVPVPHFGVVLDFDAWEQVAERLKAHGVEFVIEPYIRFKGLPGEQGTMFLYDPSGNAVEIKGFRDLGSLFAK